MRLLVIVTHDFVAPVHSLLISNDQMKANFTGCLLVVDTTLTLLNVNCVW